MGVKQYVLQGSQREKMSWGCGGGGGGVVISGSVVSQPGGNAQRSDAGACSAREQTSGVAQALPPDEQGKGRKGWGG